MTKFAKNVVIRLKGGPTSTIMDKQLQFYKEQSDRKESPMSNSFTFQHSLHDAIVVPDSGILSKPIDSDDFARVTLFGIAAGEELTEHTTPRQAYVHFLEGEGEISLGNEQHPVQAGTWVRMSPT